MSNISKAGFTCILIILFSILAQQPLAGQMDTLIIGPLEVYGSKEFIADINLPVFVDRYSVSPAEVSRYHSLGDFLSRRSGINMRSYGPGTLHTISSRGFNSSQNQIIWNGMQLNHPMVGVSDLSLIPISILSEVSVFKGMGSGEYGASAMGSVIVMNSKFREKQISIHSDLTSFQNNDIGENYRTGLVIHDQAGIFRIQTILSILKEGNSFNYEDITLNPPVIKVRRNNDRIGVTLINQLSTEIDHNQIEINSWFTESNNQIPGPIISGTTRAHQTDRVFRLNVTILRKYSEFVTGIQPSFQYHQLDYYNPDILLESLSKSYSTGIETFIQKNNGNKGLTVRSGYFITSINTSEYTSSVRRQYYIMLNTFTKVFSNHRIFNSVRFDHYNQFDGALTGSLGFNANLIQDKLVYRIMASRSYSPPTFNDLFWPELGNSDLTAENSIKYETGISFEERYFRIYTTLFFAKTNDGIQWAPDVSGIFRPDNVREITSEGLEVSVKHFHQLGQVEAVISAQWSYTNSYYSKSRFQGDQATGKQQIYVPMFNYLATGEIKWRFALVWIEYTGESERFTLEDNSAWLEPQNFINTGISTEFRIGKYKYNWHFSIRNITDKKNESIRWYPMPGRSFHTGFRITQIKDYL